MTRGGELSPEAVRHEAVALAAYLAKPCNGGASRWLESKGFTAADRAAILAALHDAEAVA